MLGQVSMPFSMAEAAFTFLILMTVIYGSQEYTKGFVKEQTVDLQTDRVLNAAMSVDSVPEGHLGLNITGYEYWIDNNDFYMQYGDEQHSVDITSNTSIYNLNGPNSAEELENGICIIKHSNSIEFKSEVC